MRLERLSWKASVVSAILTAAALVLSAWAFFKPSEPAPPISPPAVANFGDGAIVIQGSGNTVTAKMPDSSSPSRLARALVGTWKGVTRQSAPNVEMVSTGYMRLQEAGTYNFSGDVLFRVTRSGKASELQLTALAAGTWQATGDRFVITLSDVKTMSGVASLPKLEDLTPRGSSQEYTVVELTATRLRAIGTDIRGNPVDYQATRE